MRNVSPTPAPLTSSQTVPGPRVLATALAIIATATVLRVVFFTGVVGSDDTVYVREALKLIMGEPTQSAYIASYRYGTTGTMALTMWFLGPSELSAVLPFFLSSIGEIVLIFVFAYVAWGLQAASYASLIVSALPLHILKAGVPAPDSYLSLCITATFVLFYLAERTGSKLLYFAAGAVGGFVFTIKESIIVFFSAFLGYAFWRRTFEPRWGWMVLGAALMSLANMALFWYVKNDPLYMVEMLAGKASFVAEAHVEKSPAYYLRYLFLDLRHTTILAFLATLGIMKFLLSVPAGDERHFDTGFACVWLLGLFITFTFLPISFSPLELIAKQVNYMTLFLPPFCVVAGWYLSSISKRLGLVLLAVFVLSGIVLGGLEQQAVRVYISNAKAAAMLPQMSDDAPIYSSQRVSNISYLHSAFTEFPAHERRILILETFERDVFGDDLEEGTNDLSTAYVVADRETMDWRKESAALRVPGECITSVRELEPAGFGAGRTILAATHALVSHRMVPIPQWLRTKLVAIADAYSKPKPAELLRIDARCVRRAR